jgi:hypothetical protein
MDESELMDKRLKNLNVDIEKRAIPKAQEERVEKPM